MNRIPIVKWPAKQVYENLPYQIQMKKWMARGEVIQETAVRVYPKGGNPDVAWLDEMLHAKGHDPIRSIVQAHIQGGNPNLATEPVKGLYRVRFQILTVAGSRYEAEGELQVVEVV